MKVHERLIQEVIGEANEQEGLNQPSPDAKDAISDLQRWCDRAYRLVSDMDMCWARPKGPAELEIRVADFLFVPPPEGK